MSGRTWSRKPFGAAPLSWSVIGSTASGAPFERAGSDAVQIGRRSLMATAVGAEIAEPRAGASGYFSALVVPIDVVSDCAGESIVVANTVRRQAMAIGINRVNLRFEERDLYASGSKGPYRLTNVVTTEQRDEGLLSDWSLDRLTTRNYDHRVFGAPAPSACGRQCRRDESLFWLQPGTRCRW